MSDILDMLAHMMMGIMVIVILGVLGGFVLWMIVTEQILLLSISFILASAWAMRRMDRL